MDGETASTSAVSSRAKKSTNLRLDLAQVQWLKDTNNGAFMNNDAVKLLRSTQPKSKFPYDAVVTIVRTIADIARTGWLPETAPDPAQGTKIRFSAIGRFIGHSAGWVGGAIKLHEQLQAFKRDGDVQDRLRRRRHGLVGVKTLLKEIKIAVDGKREDDEENGKNETDEDEEMQDKGGKQTDDDGEDEDEDEEIEDDVERFASEMPQRGVNYGWRIVMDSESDEDMD